MKAPDSLFPSDFWRGLPNPPRYGAKERGRPGVASLALRINIFLNLWLSVGTEECFVTFNPLSDWVFGELSVFSNDLFMEAV